MAHRNKKWIYHVIFHSYVGLPNIWKTMSSSVGIIIPNLWKTKIQTTNQLLVSCFFVERGMNHLWGLALLVHEKTHGLAINMLANKVAGLVLKFQISNFQTSSLLISFDWSKQTCPFCWFTWSYNFKPSGEAKNTKAWHHAALWNQLEARLPSITRKPAWAC